MPHTPLGHIPPVPVPLTSLSSPKTLNPIRKSPRLSQPPLPLPKPHPRSQATPPPNHSRPAAGPTALPAPRLPHPSLLKPRSCPPRPSPASAPGPARLAPSLPPGPAAARPCPRCASAPSLCSSFASPFCFALIYLLFSPSLSLLSL